MSYTKNGLGTEIIEENNFYPFGLRYDMNSLSSGNPSYNYQYNGKELQKETGWSDFGARMYMPDIARWCVIDPLAETSRRFTPYNYALNNPVMFIDPDGRKAEIPVEPMEMNAPEGSLWWAFAKGGYVSAFSGDGVGDFFTKINNSGGGGGGSDDEAQTVGETDWYKNLMASFYFGDIDFEQFLDGDDNEEEPVNFFGKTGDDAPFYQKFKEMYKMFKDTKGDGVFRAFGHGGVGINMGW